MRAPMKGFVGALMLVGAAAVRTLPPMTLQRRQVVALLALPLGAPAAAHALFDGSPRGLTQLVDAKRRLDEIARDLDKDDLRESNEDDATFVLRTSAVYFKQIPAVMQKTTAAMSQLEAAQVKAASDLTFTCGEQLRALEDAARARDKAMLDASKKASAALADYLAVASAAKYKVPEAWDNAFSSDPGTFSSQYFGFLSCEGQGLERIKGSNSCKDAPRKQGSASPRKDNSFRLDFDFLTGAPRP